MTREKTLTFNNETLNLTQWANKLGISRETIRYRLRIGLPVSEVLETKMKTSNQYDTVAVDVNGVVVSMPVRMWLSVLGISRQALHQGTKLHNRTQEEEILHRLKCKRDAVPPSVVKAVMEAYGKYQETLFTPEIRTLIRNNKDFVLKILAGVE